MFYFLFFAQWLGLTVTAFLSNQEERIRRTLPLYMVGLFLWMIGGVPKNVNYHFEWHPPFNVRLSNSVGWCVNVCTHFIVKVSVCARHCCPSSSELRLQLPDGSIICRSHSGQLQQNQVTWPKLIILLNASMETQMDDFNVFTSSENQATWSALKLRSSLSETYYLQDCCCELRSFSTVCFWWQHISPGPSGKDLKQDSGQIT